jgi:hypothetical protein
LRGYMETFLGSWICPGVAEMHVEVYIQTCGLGTLCKSNVVCEVVIST